MIFEWPWTSNLSRSYIIRPSQIHRRAIFYVYLGGYCNLSPFWVPDMVCKVILLCPISTFLLLIENGYLFLKFTVYIVKFDKKQNPLKSIAENDSSLPQCIWIVCTTPELICGRGGGWHMKTCDRRLLCPERSSAARRCACFKYVSEYGITHHSS